MINVVLENDDITVVLDSSKIIIEPVTQEKTAKPSEQIQEIIPDEGYTGLSKVTVQAVNTEDIEVQSSVEDKVVNPTQGKFINQVTVKGDSNLVPENIKKDVTILGVVGKVEGLSGNENMFTLEERRISSTTNYLLDIIINQNVDDYAFFSASTNYSYIRNIVSRENCLSVGESCFRYQTLGIVNMPYVKTIGNYAFNSSNITELYLPKSEGTFGQSACSNCKRLTKVVLGEITLFKGPDFVDDTLLSVFIIYAKIPPVVSNSNLLVRTAIDNGEGYIYVPDESVEIYKSATNWSVYANQIKGVSELPKEV